jgi:hypothetical protein
MRALFAECCLIYCYAECRYAECHYTECRYAQCRGALGTNTLVLDHPSSVSTSLISAPLHQVTLPAAQTRLPDLCHLVQHGKTRLSYLLWAFRTTSRSIPHTFVGSEEGALLHLTRRLYLQDYPATMTLWEVKIICQTVTRSYAKPWLVPGSFSQDFHRQCYLVPIILNLKLLLRL